MLENRFSKLNLEGHPVELMPCPTKAESAIIVDRLKEFDPGYNESYTNKSQLKKMPLIADFFGSSDHCCYTSYSAEFRLCGKLNCCLCGKVGRSMHVPDVVVDGVNVRKEVLHLTILPVPNTSDKDHYLSPAEAREYIEKNNLTLDDLKEFIPGSKH
eukprot:14086419-Ditylum_brightwellii.AAC.1